MGCRGGRFGSRGPELNAIERHRWKFAYLVKRQLGACAIWKDRGRHRGRSCMRPEALHHRLPNKKINRRRFPLLIDSMLNLVAVNQGMHMEWPSWGRFSLRKAEQMERTLERWPRACAFVNGRATRLDWRI